jgi:hypothetical protein
MKTLKWALAVMSISLVAACGGGKNAGNSPFGSGGCSGASAASGATGCASASNLVLSLSSATIQNDGSEKVTATATATTSSGQALAGIPVSFSVDNNANFTTSGTVTNASGQATAIVSIGADPTNRIITVQAKSSGLSASSSFAVGGSKLSSTASAAILAPGQAGTVDFRLTNAIDAALADQPISVALGSDAPVTGRTNVNGVYTFAFTAPAAVGPVNIVANAGGVSRTQTIIVQTSTTNIPPAALISSASVAANPSVVPTNTVGSTANRTEIRALFVGANNAPVKNVRVTFDLNGDPASIGGSFSTGNAILYTDDNGIATTAYIPADRASPTNGVTIRACYSTTDFVPAALPPAAPAPQAPSAQCPNQTLATITVVADPLSVTVGSNEFVYLGANELTYIRKFVILVVDAAGRAKGNVEVVPSLDLLYYYKGRYVRSATWITGVYDSTTGAPSARPPFRCLNEDSNRNGVLETSNPNEDLNQTGALEPRKSDAVVSFIEGSKTKADGTVLVQIEYPRNVATWVEAKLLVSATGISGTEGRATWQEILPAPAEAFSGTGAPAFVFSPYGLDITPSACTVPD